MSQSDRISIRPICFGTYEGAKRDDRGCFACLEERHCIQPSSTAHKADETQVGGEHYRSKAVQPWAAMQAWMTQDEFAGFLRGNVIKYVARCNDKGGIEDLKKARHYLDKLIEVIA